MIGANKSRILLVDLADAMGGVETYLQNLQKLLQESFDVRLVTPLRDLEAKFTDAGARVYLLPSICARSKPICFLFSYFYIPIIVLRDKINVIQINGYLESIFIPLMNLLKKRVVYTRHGPPELDLYSWRNEPSRRLPRYLSAKLMRYASYVVCVSKAVEIANKPYLNQERLITISNWVPFPSEPSIRAALKSHVEILFVGRLETYKGLDLLLDAIRRIGNIKLTVIGVGVDMERLRYLATGLNVAFLGYQSDVSSYYRNADLFVMPSRGPEGLPMVTLEAMSWGIPCILSDLPVHKEVAESGEAAMLFRCGDADDLHSKIDNLIRNPRTYRTYGERGRARVLSEYSPASAFPGYFKIFAMGSIGRISNSGGSHAC